MRRRRFLIAAALLLLAAAAGSVLADTAPLQVTYFYLPG
jgi:hypothetical protein